MLRLISRLFYPLVTSMMGKKKLITVHILQSEKSENWPGENVLFIDVQ